MINSDFCINNNNNCINNCINNSNNNYDVNSDNIKIYNSVWNNLYLKKIILGHLNIFNILNVSVIFRSLEEWEQFRYKEYLHNVRFEFVFCNNHLPENIKRIQLKLPATNCNIITLPNHVESVSISQIMKIGDINSTFSPSLISKIDSLTFNITNKGRGYHLPEPKDKAFPEQIKSLTIYSSSASENVLKKNVLPNSIKSLHLIYIERFQDGFLPQSLSVAKFEESNSLIINQLSSSSTLSNSLTTLDFSTSETKGIGSHIKFPSSLQHLNLRCLYFNGNLPDGLKSLCLSLNQVTSEIKFPSSLETIIINFSQKPNNEFQSVFRNSECVPNNLKTLEIPCTSLLDYSCGGGMSSSLIKDKLERLCIYGFITDYEFHEVLQMQHFPLSTSSLTHLDLGPDYNQVINVNILPNTLKKLKLGISYTQTINPLAIPQNLQLLKILNHNYSHPINLSLTHPFTLISCNKIDLYYNEYDKSIRSLRLPNRFNKSLSTLKLQDKSNLEYLHLGLRFDRNIELSDLPIQNNIKTLELCYNYDKPINLDHFQNLETIISNSVPVFTPTTNIYSLKNIFITTKYKNLSLLNNLDPIFYKLLQIKSNI